MGKKKKNDIVGKIPKGVWLLISLAVALILWTLLSFGKSTGRVFPNVIVVAQSIGTMIERGLLFKDIGSSLISVIAGFAIGFVTSIPVAFLMAWYRPVRYIVEPWIQFIRNIPAPGLCSPGCYRCGRRTDTSDYRDLAGHLPDYDSDGFSGCDQCG